MDEKPERRRWVAAGRTLLCGILGGIAGVAIGATIGYCLVPVYQGDPGDAGIFGILGGFMQLIFALLGGGAGGIIGGIAGAVAATFWPSPKRDPKASRGIET
jgi:hypothetical protein